MTVNFLLVGDGGHVERMDSTTDVSSRILQAQLSAPLRADSAGRMVRDYSGYAWTETEHTIAARIDSALDVLRRNDNFSAALGAGLSPRDLTHKMRRVLETPMQPMTSEQAIPANPELQPGALTWEQHRIYESGEAFVYRGGSGSDVAPVALGGATMTGQVVYLISKSTMNWLEDLVLNRAGVGLDTRARKMRVQRDVIRRLENRWNWLGASEHGIYGVYNNPYIDTALSDVSYVAASDADDILADMVVWGNYAENESGSVFQPNQLSISPKLLNYLQTRPYGTNRDKFLMEAIQKALPHITRIVRCPELNDVGGTNIHGMFFSRVGSGPTDSSIERLTVMPPTLLPPDQRALGSDFYMVGATGGVHQTSAGDNLFVLVQGE